MERQVCGREKILKGKNVHLEWTCSSFGSIVKSNKCFLEPRE